MVEYIEINGVKHPVRINRKVLVTIEKMTGKGLQALGELDTQTLTDLVYAGIQEGYRFLKEKNHYKNKEEFENEVDDTMDVMEFYDSASKVITNFFSPKEKKE